MTYSSGAAAALGSLLRKAQEDRQTGPHLIPQSAQEESPIRQQITGPIAAPESVGSEKVVSMKGEMQPIQEGATQAPINVDGNVSPLVVPPVVSPVSGMEGSTPSPVTPSFLASSVTPSGIGSPLLPSSMKGTSVKSAPSILGKSVSQPQPATVSKYGNIPGGTITQGRPIKSKSQSILEKIPGYLARGASAVSRAALSLPMLMSGEMLKKAVESTRNLGRGKTIKG